MYLLDLGGLLKVAHERERGRFNRPLHLFELLSELFLEVGTGCAVTQDGLHCSHQLLERWHEGSADRFWLALMQAEDSL